MFIRLSNHSDYGRLVTCDKCTVSVSKTRAEVWSCGLFSLTGFFKKCLCWFFTCVQALHFIHGSAIVYHGSLSMLTCLVDSRFSVKVSEAGYSQMEQILAANKTSKLTSTHTHQGEDVKNYGHILSHLISDTSSENTGNKLLPRNSVGFFEFFTFWRKTSRSFRFSPSIFMNSVHIKCRFWIIIFVVLLITLDLTEDKRTEVLHKLDDVVKSCQQTDERHRPNAANLLRLIKTFTNDNHSIVERLMNKVTQHAEGLQIVVSERTQELLAETLNVDNLLREILPQYGQRQKTIQCMTWRSLLWRTKPNKYE